MIAQSCSVRCATQYGTQPVAGTDGAGAHLVVPNLMYAGSGHEAKTVMVAGKLLVRDGEVTTADEAAIRAEAQTKAEAVAGRVAADPVHEGMALLEAMKTGQL